jgi:hypothetical protein
MGEREAQSTAARACERASVPEREKERERERERRIDSKGIGWASAETNTCREIRRSYCRSGKVSCAFFISFLK